MILFSFSTLRTVLSGWLETYPGDFYTPDDMFELLIDILDLASQHMGHLMELREKVSRLKNHFKRVEMAVSERMNLE